MIRDTKDVLKARKDQIGNSDTIGLPGIELFDKMVSKY